MDYHLKKNYIIHYLTLQCYLKIGGFKIERINYIIRFKQASYMREYIELNHRNRCESKNKIYDSLFKLLGSSLCGRTLLNKKKYNSNIKIVSDIDKTKKTVSKQTFKDYEIINEQDESVLFNIEKQYVKLDAPLYIGSTTLDLSKILIYEYFYKLKDKYKDNISMLYIDTDGFVCNIRNNDDVYKDMYEMDMFDMSCYDSKFKYYRHGNYEMGKIKDECPMSVITEAITLKDKLYAYKRESDEIKCKGVKYNINFQSLKNAVFCNESITAKFNTIKSTKDCKIYSYTDSKILAGYSDKRFLFNQTMSYPYGHYMINKNYEDII